MATTGRFTLKNSTVRFEDAAGLGLTVGPGPGNFTDGPNNAGNAAKIRVLDRASYDTHVEGEDLEQTWSITVQLVSQALTSATLARIHDFLQKTGSFAAAQTTNPNPDIWAFKVIHTAVKGGVTTTRTYPNCLADQVHAEAADGNTLAISGTNNGAPTFA